MRRIFLLPILLFSFSLSAQIIILQDDMPNTGDTIRYSTSIDLGGINFEETGENHNWNFSSLLPLTQAVDTFTSVSETPLVYQVVFFLYSNLAKPLTSFDEIPGFEVSDPYEFYKKSSSEYKMVGYGITMNGIPIPNKFENADVIYHFPISYSTVDSSYSSYEFDIPTLGYLGGWKKRVNYCDGWGTLTTPFGTFQTLRLKSEIIQFDSIYIDSLGLGLPITRNFTEYKWLGNDFGLPLCKVMDDGLLTQIEYLDSARSLLVNVNNEVAVMNKISIFPNPAKERLYIKSDQKILSFTLFNSHGNHLMTNGVYANDFSFRLSDYSPGIYMIAIKTEDQIQYEKIIFE
jgi:hypothetical protein